MLPWRNPDLAALYGAIDTYENAHKLRATKQGNRSYPRHFEASATPSKRAAVKGLPKNFYDTQFLKGLTGAQRRGLRLQPFLEIPELVRRRRYLLPSQTAA